MFLIELFVPKGTFDEEQRRRIAERIVTGLVPEDNAAAESIGAFQAITQVLVHEPETWLVGKQPVTATGPVHYLVRISVPGAWRKESSEHFISSVTRVLAEVDEDPERLYREPHAWVQVVGVPEGGYGLFGQAQGSNDLARMMSEPYQKAREEGSLPEPPPGTVYDPQCGAIVPLDVDAVTLEHDGTTYAFCCAGCRRIFTDELRAATPSAPAARP